MAFNLCKGLYVGKLKFLSKKEHGFNAVIDTGAVHSFLTTGYLEEAIPNCTKYINDCAESTGIAKMADGSPISVVAVLLRNVSACGIELSKFQCLVGVTAYKQCLLGTDFISAGNWHIVRDSLELVDFSMDVYEDNLQKYYRHALIELNVLSCSAPTEEQLQWCRNAAPEALRHLPDAVLWDIMYTSYFENN